MRLRVDLHDQRVGSLTLSHGDRSEFSFDRSYFEVPERPLLGRAFEACLSGCHPRFCVGECRRRCAVYRGASEAGGDRVTRRTSRTRATPRRAPRAASNRPAVGATAAPTVSGPAAVPRRAVGARGLRARRGER